ncbi:hypothetical protein [Actinophytocola oryzae]|uniref:Small secreted domain DUF320 n=1 Tax=Actinophytocola oryzae TaxID=502181 RepID=A0A4R7VRC0_9PSEU|nr:hypothetical protein [Actinophytocola oryzae]TDV51909.1 hypothetical protein CLV71_10538 [Actinophytocola oryzae]
MLKKVIIGAAALAAGMVPLAAGQASASPFTGPADDNQVGVANLNNLDVLHNVNANVGVCDNTIGILAVQVPIEDVANGLGVSALTSGENEGLSAHPESCAANHNVDGGTLQSK